MTHSLGVYVAFQKAETVRRGNFLPGIAEIRNTDNYILNDSSIGVAWSCFISLLFFYISFHPLLLVLYIHVTGTVLLGKKKVGIKKLFSHLFPSAKLPIEAEQHPLYHNYGFPHLGMLFLSFSACQQTELRVMKAENKACIRPYLFTYIKSIYLHEWGKWDISCICNYEQHTPLFQKMTHL